MGEDRQADHPIGDPSTEQECRARKQPTLEEPATKNVFLGFLAEARGSSPL